jgi:hypothetical protein
MRHPKNLSRRGAIELLGAMGAACVSGCGGESGDTSGKNRASGAGGATSASSTAAGSAACHLTPEQEEGPFYVDLGLLRSDITDAAGKVKFTTIYPGWYAGRTCHIHIKVHVGGMVSGATYKSAGSTVVHGGQMFFPVNLNASLKTSYADNTNAFINNDADKIYTDQGGTMALITMDGSLEAGFQGSIVTAVKSA